MDPYAYQVEISKQAYSILKEYMIVYLALEERVGKTLTAILTAELTTVDNILVITKKKALDGWHDTLGKYETTKQFTVINYHQVHKIKDKYELVILDESHNYISAYPKIGTTATRRRELSKSKKPNVNIYDNVKRVATGCPIIYLSATPHAQGTQMLFHQLSVSSWSPWRKYQHFYAWFNVYGLPYTKEIRSINIQQYDRAKQANILADVNHLFITKTRKELDFAQEPEDKLHIIKLGENTRYVYNQLLEHDLCELSVGVLVCDTDSKLRTSLHQLEGGTMKIFEDRFVLANTEKIDYILNVFGDKENLVIMYNYQAEKVKLNETFKKAMVLQATSFAEGVDLSAYEHLVIYSQDFSTARHTQRRARQANKNRQAPIIVHYLLVKGAISEQVYKTVSVNKKNYVDSIFQRTKL